VHTEVRVPRRRAGQTRRSVPVDVVEGVRALAYICSDDRIAAWLTRNGVQTSVGTLMDTTARDGIASPARHPRASVAARRKLEAYESDAGRDLLEIDRVTLRVAVERGQIKAVRPLAGGVLVARTIA